MSGSPTRVPPPNVPNVPQPPKFATNAEERLHRKRMLAAAFRLFSRFGFDEGVAGHVTARDPERLDHFWVNPFGMYFGHIRASDLILVNHEGEVVEGGAPAKARALRDPFADPRRPPRRDRRRSFALDARQGVLEPGAAARSAD